METIDMAIVQRAAAAIAEADALYITAGAGMGVDSGLPDFRGPQGFWRAYPAYEHLGLRFEDMANPRWFVTDPGFAWGFYGHRLNLYRRTVPHAGFGILRRWSEGRAGFVFTSNVDGQFQRAGWSEEQVFEVHGSIHALQCARPCEEDVWAADGAQITVDATTFRANEPLPQCPHCGGVARPNILMFGDGAYLGLRADAQWQRAEAWFAGRTGARIVVVEMGAGTGIPTVRHEGEQVMRRYGATLIRINPRESFGPPRTLSIPAGARAGLEAIDAALRAL